ncbi:MAG: MFS transporter [Syntrophaceae bacterium]|nr:MFS transporter [Syntrophaceae bacterium]
MSEANSISSTAGGETTGASGGQANAPPVWQRPTLGTKLIYTIPAFASSLLMAPFLIELKIFYTDTVLVPAGLLAIIMAITRAWDALNDPVMGWISDHTRTRWGRRRPWIAIGLPFSALFYWLLFVPPESYTATEAALWAGVMYFTYELFHTVFVLPYGALGFELTPDYHDRTTIFGYRQMFAGIGIISAFALLYYIRAADIFEGDDRKMLFYLTGCFALLWVIFYSVPVIKIKENPIFQQFKRSPIVPGVRRALRNRPFRILLWVSILGTIPISMPLLMMPYFVKYVIGATSEWRLIFAIIYTIAGFLSIPLWMYISRRFGKLHVWMIAIGLGICASLAMFFVGKGQTQLMGVFEVFRGFGSGAAGILGPAMMADIIDYDELRTGKRREAQFGAFLGLIPKLVAIFAAVLPLALLGAVGYNPATAADSPTSIFTIRVLYALLPMAFHVVCLTILMAYPITAEIHEAIREGVERHKKGEDAQDPLTHRTLKPADAQLVPELTGWFLDYFSPGELRRFLEKGPANSGLLQHVYLMIGATAGVCVGCVTAIYFLLINSMTTSQTDQINQGIAAFLVFFAGLSIAALMFHCMRIRSAQRMLDNPIDNETITNHISQI